MWGVGGRAGLLCWAGSDLALGHLSFVIYLNAKAY